MSESGSSGPALISSFQEAECPAEIYSCDGRCGEQPRTACSCHSSCEVSHVTRGRLGVMWLVWVVRGGAWESGFLYKWSRGRRGSRVLYEWSGGAWGSSVLYEWSGGRVGVTCLMWVVRGERGVTCPIWVVRKGRVGVTWLVCVIRGGGGKRGVTCLIWVVRGEGGSHVFYMCVQGERGVTCLIRVVRGEMFGTTIDARSGNY